VNEQASLIDNSLFCEDRGLCSSFPYFLGGSMLLTSPPPRSPVFPFFSPPYVCACWFSSVTALRFCKGWGQIPPLLFLVANSCGSRVLNSLAVLSFPSMRTQTSCSFSFRPLCPSFMKLINFFFWQFPLIPFFPPSQ